MKLDVHDPPAGWSTASQDSFSILADSMERARAAAPVEAVEMPCVLAGRRVRWRVAGRELARRLTHSLSHLSRHVPQGPDALCIDLWDEEATGVAPPDVEARQARVRKHATAAGGLLEASRDGRFAAYTTDHSTAVLDREGPRLLGWFRSPSSLTLFEQGKPLHFLLSIWHRDRGVQIMHTALVSRHGRSVLFPGMGGAGKTTSALSCLCSGFDYLGDDYIGIEQEADGSFTGHSLYNSTWLESDHLLRFPPLVPHARSGLPPPRDKRLVLLADVFPERMSIRAPVHAIAMPRLQSGPDTRFREVPASKALVRIAPSSMLALRPRPGPKGLERLAALVQSVPCFELELGRRIEGIPIAVASLLDRISSGT